MTIPQSGASGHQRSDLGAQKIVASPARQQHHVAFHDRDRFLVSSVTDFVFPALQQQDIGVVAGTAEHLAAFERTLEGMGIDIAAARERGNYIAVDAQAALDEVITDGQVDEGRFMAFATELVEGAAASGRELRIAGEMAPLLWALGDVEGALALEHWWNHLPTSAPFQLLCCYPMRTFDGDGATEPFMTLCDHHQDVIPDEPFALTLDPLGWPRTVAIFQQQAHAHAAANETLRIERSQLAEALGTRDVIGQAKGILMVRFHVDEPTAFELLRQASNRGNQKLRDVASQVVAQQQLRN